MIETERLFIRPMSLADRPALATLLHDEEVMYAYAHAFSEQEVDNWLGNQLRRYHEKGFGLQGVYLKTTQEFIGQVGITWQKWKNENVPEIGYLLKKEYWHQGFATEATQKMKEIGFEKMRLAALYSIIRDNNYPSQRVAQRNQMEKVGIENKYYYGIEMPHIVFKVNHPLFKKNEN